jgi:hypothetical protein
VVKKRERVFTGTIEDRVIVASRRDALGKGYVLYYDRDADGERILVRQRKS